VLRLCVDCIVSGSASQGRCLDNRVVDRSKHDLRLTEPKLKTSYVSHILGLIKSGELIRTTHTYGTGQITDINEVKLSAGMGMKTSRRANLTSRDSGQGEAERIHRLCR